MRFSRAITSRHAAAPASQTVVAPSKARCWSSRACRSPGFRATLPTVGVSSPVMSLKIDVLPAPLRPMIPHRSPSATVKVTFLKSSVAPKETPMLESERRVTPGGPRGECRHATNLPGKICQTRTSQTPSPRYHSRIDGPYEDIPLQSIACSALVRLTLLAASSLIAGSRAVAQEASLHGVVYADANANGKRDASERGVSGVVVSNQRDEVVTDSLGRFDLPAGTTGLVFVSVPNGFRSSGAFWRATTTASTS